MRFDGNSLPDTARSSMGRNQRAGPTCPHGTPRACQKVGTRQQVRRHPLVDAAAAGRIHARSVPAGVDMTTARSAQSGVPCGSDQAYCPALAGSCDETWTVAEHLAASGGRYQPVLSPQRPGVTSSRELPAGSRT
jgi:hypothetical protein